MEYCHYCQIAFIVKIVAIALLVKTVSIVIIVRLLFSCWVLGAGRGVIS